MKDACPRWIRSVVAAAVVALLLPVGLEAAAAVRGAPAAAVGEMRVLVIRATWGPTPGQEARVAAELAEAAAFFRRASFGKLDVSFEITPWVRAYDNTAICPTAEDEEDERRSALGPISRRARTAAASAGYDPLAYDRVVFLLPDPVCGFPGLGVRGEVLLANPDQVSWVGIVHELGHTLGLAHATSSACARGCRVLRYGDHLSPMGQGYVDFSAFEKHQLGWLSATVATRRSGSYAIRAVDVATSSPQALIVPAAQGEYWLEHRSQPARLVVRFVHRVDPRSPVQQSILLPGTLRTFKAPGGFTVRVTQVTDDQVLLAIRFVRR
jgi:hypothetical protein